MARGPNSTAGGSRFGPETILAVWRRARIVPGQDPNQVRLDACGARIYWVEYGVTTPKGFGWEIDHVVPVARGGTDALDNLQALQWENNRHKSDSWPQWGCYIHYPT